MARPPMDAEPGRGLLLVAALADDWGVAPCEGALGETVWADGCPAGVLGDQLGASIVRNQRCV
jgi:hypothetical protein